MTRTEFEKYLGKDVTITLYDGAIYAGILHQTGEKAFADNPNLSVPLNFYFCIDENNEVVKNTVFRVSHIQKISCNEKLRMTNFERIKSMSIDEMARSCIDFSVARMALRMSAVLWKSDSITAVLTAQNIGLKVR